MAAKKKTSGQRRTATPKGSKPRQRSSGRDRMATDTRHFRGPKGTTGDRTYSASNAREWRKVGDFAFDNAYKEGRYGSTLSKNAAKRSYGAASKARKKARTRKKK